MRKKQLVIIFSILAFTALVVLLGSVIFSVKQVSVFCINADDTALEDRVERAVDMGGSIFFLNEKAHIKAIEEMFPEVVVNTIERVFPSSVRIEIIKKFRCAYIEIDGTYYILDDDARIVAEQNSVPDNVIKVEIDKTSVSKSIITQKIIGKALKTDRGFVELMLKELFTAMFRLGYDIHDTTTLYKSIVCETEERELILYTQGGAGGSGAKIVIIGTDKVDEKVRRALSLYSEDDKYKKGTIRVYTRLDTGEIVFTHEP